MVTKLCVVKLCVNKLCGDKLCVVKLCVSKLYGDKLCVVKLCVNRRRAGGREEEGGSAQPKTRTPHKDVGNGEKLHLTGQNLGLARQLCV